MKKLKTTMILIAVIISLLLFISADNDGYKSPDQGFSNAQSGKIVIMPERLLREYDPVTIFYPVARGPKQGGPEDHPEKFVKTTLEWPGEFRWIDDKTLQFHPTIPWAPLKKFAWKVDDVNKEFFTMINPPTAVNANEEYQPVKKQITQKYNPEYDENGDEIINDQQIVNDSQVVNDQYDDQQYYEDNNNNNQSGQTAELFELKQLVVTFPQEIKLEELKSIISIEIRSLPGIENKNTVWLSGKDFLIKRQEQKNIQDSFKYVILLSKPVGPGKKIFLHLKLSLDETISGSKISYDFSTKTDFSLIAVGSGNYLYPVTSNGSVYTTEQAINGGDLNQVALVFSDQPKTITFSQVKQLVSFTPAVSNLNFSLSSQNIYLSGNFERDRLYEVSVNPLHLQDKYERKLTMKGVTKFYIFFPEKKSFIQWQQSQGVVELYGPKQFPMQGRSVKKIDLRIYKVDPLSRKLWPFPEYPVVIDEGTMKPGPGEEPPEKETSFEYVSEQALKDHLKMLGSPPVSRIIDLPISEKSGSFSFGLDIDPIIDEKWKDNKAGTYIIGYRNLDGGKNRTYVRLQITDLCLTTVEENGEIKFYVTSYKTALPVSGADITIQGYENYNNDKYRYKWIDLFKGRTDGNGMFSVRKTDNNDDLRLKRVVIKKENDIIVLNPNNSMPSFNNNYWNQKSWLQSIIQSPVSVTASRKGFIFTERPVYKPEEPVYIKGYLRDRLKGRLSFINNDNDYKVYIKGPGGKEWNYPVDISEHGSFDLKFEEKDLPTGNYAAMIGNADSNGNLMSSYASVNFKKEAYKIPMFEVVIHGEKKVPMDREFKVSLTADYYAGGKVTDCPVLWTVTEFPFAYQPDGMEGYLFSSDSRFSSKSNKFSSNGLLRIENNIDKTGYSVITVDPTLARDNMPRRYVFEATLTGDDEQTVTSTYDVFAVPSFILGMKVERFVKQGYEIKPSIIAVDPDNKNISDLPVIVRLKKREWHSHLKESSLSDSKPQYVTEQVDLVLEEKTVKTEAKETGLTFKVPAAGIYLIELEARDKIGRMQTLVTDIYVGGEGVMTWKAPEDMKFRTVCDKVSYDPGDKVSILLQSPYLSAKVLAIVEKPDADEFSWLDVDDGKALFNLKVENYFNPGIPVTFILMSPRIYEDGKALKSELEDAGKPATLASTQWINVNPAENTLNIELKHAKQSSPGKKMDMEINLKDDKGKPVPGEVTLWLVDQAVLALGDEQSLDPLPHFIDENTSMISVTDLRNQVIGKLKITENPGGGGYDEESMRESQEDLLDKATVRKNFKTIAYYSPSIIIDQSGTKKITIELPDNLTIFQIRSVACSKAERFGFAKSSVEIRLPLIVQSALPRFVRFGDEINAGGIGRIVLGEGGKGNVKIEATNAVITGKTLLDVDWKSDTAHKFYFPMKINQGSYSQDGTVLNNELKIKMAVSRLKDEATDAFEVSIPIRDDTSWIKTGFMKELAKNETAELPYPEYKPRTGSLKQDIMFTSELPVLKAIYGMEYLLQYPYGCLEQKISKAYSALLLKQIYNKYNITDIAPNVDKIFYETMDTIERCRKNDGLYSYWPGSTGYVYLSAYVLIYLVEAKKAGYAISSEMTDSLVKVLKRALRSDYSQFITGYEYNERVEALFALSDAGYFDSSYGDSLARTAYNYNIESRSRILLTLQKNSYYDTTLVANLKKNLMDNAVFTLFNGKEIFSGMQDKSKIYGGLINSYETKSLANVISALSYKTQYEGRLKLMLDNLITLGDKDGWGNTYTNAAVFAALKDYLTNQKSSGQKFTLNIKTAGKDSSLDIGGTKNVANWIGTDYSKGNLTLKNSPDNEKKAYVSVTSSYLPDVPGDMIKSQNNGFVVDREIIIVGKNPKPDTKIWLKKTGESIKINLGDIVEEHVQIINPADRYFVAIVCPLAAGLEPMNPNLKTAPPEARTKGNDTIKPDYAQFLDDKVCYFFDRLPKGTYDFYFRTRAMTEGSFVEPCAVSEMMYQETIRGNSFGARFVISP